MAAPATLIARQGDTLDLLIWRDAGLGAADIGRILEANPGLADAGTVLPIGTRVLIPASPSAGIGANRVRPLIQLWD